MTDFMENVVTNLRCPISGQLYTDPVIVADGFTYDRPMIEKWFLLNDTSPLTNEILDTTMIIPNKTIKNFIGDLLEFEKNKKKCAIDTQNISQTITHNNEPHKIKIIDKKMVLSRKNICVKNYKLRNMIFNYGLDYLDPKGNLLLELILSTTKSYEMVNFIIDYHVMYNILEKKYYVGNTYFNLIHIICKYFSKLEKFAKIMKKIIGNLSNHCYLESRDSNGWNILHHVCKYGTVNNIKYVIKLINIVNITNLINSTGTTNTTNTINKKIDLNVETNMGYLPFHIVCKFGKAVSIKYMTIYIKKTHTESNNFKNKLYKKLLRKNNKLSQYEIGEVECFILKNN